MPATEPRVTYPVSLADLVAFADCAATLDSLKGYLVDRPCDIDIINSQVQRVYDAIERSAGDDVARIFPEDV